METALIVCLALGIASASPASLSPAPLINEVNQVRNDALDNYVRLVINDLFAAMTTGIPGLGIPPLDPLKIGNITIPTLTVPGGSIDARVSDIQINQLSQLRLTSLHTDVDHLVMNLRSFLPTFKISGSYKLNGIMLKIFPLYGDGPFSVDAFDLIMLGGGSLGFDPDRHLQLTSIAMDTNFTTMVVDFENLMGGGDLGDTLNAIMTNLGTTIFNQVKPYVIEVLDSSIIKVINAALAKLPPFPALP